MDFPWTGGTFVATPAFEPVGGHSSMRCVRAVPNKKSSDEIIMREFEEAWQRIAAPDLRLAPDEPGEENYHHVYSSD